LDAQQEDVDSEDEEVRYAFGADFNEEWVSDKERLFPCAVMKKHQNRTPNQNNNR
jgi:hypothetical protein